MWNNKDLKRNARVIIKKNYMKIIITSFIIAFIASGYDASSYDLNMDLNDTETIVFRAPTLSKELDRTIKFLEGKAEVSAEKIQKKYKLKDASEGAIAKVINNATHSNSILVGVLNSINQFLFHEKILEGVIMSIASLVMLFYWIFIQNVLIVGEYRFFLETKSYTDTDVGRILFIFRIKRTVHIAKVMFFRFLYNFLWYLTIIGGFIKTYEYTMIPYILAENPDIPIKNAFALSKEMMKGNKFKTFLLDLSFIPWYILSSFTFGLVGYLYSNPFFRATKAELYFALRQNQIDHNTALSGYFNDDYLLNKPTEDTKKYPTHLFSINEQSARNWLGLDYNHNYSFLSLVYLFIIVSCIGWVWEVFLFLFSTGNFYNRGTLTGPWLPIYGSGTVIILILLRRFANKPPLFFGAIFVTCGVFEYFTSWMLELIFRKRWWEYSKVFFNINGRICLEGLLFFSIGGCLITYFLAPLIDELVLKIPIFLKKKICILLVILFVVDIFYSIKNPNIGEGITGTVQTNVQNL